MPIDLAALTPVANHRPWPRYEVDAAQWNAIGASLGKGEADLLALWAEPDFVHLAFRSPAAAPVLVSLPVRDGAFPSVGKHHPPAIRLERTIADLYGHVAIAAPDTRAWLDHGAWGVRAPTDYEFQPVRGEGLHQIPVGPVHAGIIEPGHFRFTANGEIVVRLEERLGYVHKGIDGLLINSDAERAARIVARTSGDSTVALSFAFALAFESARDIVVPLRAQVIRGA